MNFPTRLLVTLTSLLAATACQKSSSEGPANAIPSEISAPDVLEFCCDSEGNPPGKIGVIEIHVIRPQGDIEEGSLQGKLVYDEAMVPAPARLSVPSGQILQEGYHRVDVILDSCDVEEMTVSVRLDLTVNIKGFGGIDSTNSKTVVIRKVCSGPENPETSTADPEAMFRLIVGDTTGTVPVYSFDAPTGEPTDSTFDEVAPQVPIENYTETVGFGWAVADLDQTRLDAAFGTGTALYPVGDGPHGRGVPAELPTVMQPGPYLFAWQIVDGSIPLEHPDRQFQFAFVLDEDNDSSNNFHAQAPLSGDFFDDTDLWFDGRCEANGRWRLHVKLARYGNIMDRHSAARCIIQNNVQMFVIPVEEIDADGDQEVGARFTTFTSGPEMGQNGTFWSGDVTPIVGEPLIDIPFHEAI